MEKEIITKKDGDRDKDRKACEERCRHTCGLDVGICGYRSRNTLKHTQLASN